MHPDLQRFKDEIKHFISLKNNNYNSFKHSGFFHLVCYLTLYISINVYTCICNLKKSSSILSRRFF